MSANRRRWVWLALPVVACAASIALSWQRWINPFVDSSRELIVPLRVASGERLYSDVAYSYGPAGPWLGLADSLRGLLGRDNAEG